MRCHSGYGADPAFWTDMTDCLDPRNIPAGGELIMIALTQ